MKNLLVIFGLLCPWLLWGQQDTITVQTFTYDSISTRRAIFTFPAELQGKQFEKVLMYYNLKCDPLTPWDSYNCGEWDYLAHAKVFDHTGLYDSTLVEGPQYLVNNQWPVTVEYVANAYYNYSQNYQYNATYVGADLDYPIGNGSTTSFAAFGASNNYQRTQFLYTADELTGTGIIAGDISKLKFDIQALGGGMGNLTIKMKHTTDTVITAFDESGWSTVYHKNTNFSGAGSNTLNLTTPFNYDGASGILIDISFENTGINLDNQVAATQTSNNTVVYTNEKLGYLNVPQNDFVEIAMSDYDFQNEITISFWANGDGGILPVNTSIIEAGDSLNNRILNIHFPWSNGEHYWDAGEGNGYDRINQPATAQEIGDEWHHWAFTKNKTTGEMNIYKDGVLWLNGTGKDRLVGVVNTFKIGANRNEGNGWPGKMDEFRVWDVELSQTEISSWMDQKVTPSHPNYADLVLYYDFDGENAVVDKSGNGMDGMQTTSGMVAQYAESKAGHNVTDIRPDITFVQGAFTVVIDSVMVTDSVEVEKVDVAEYQVDGRKFVINSIDHVYPVGYGYTYDPLGNIIDSTYHGADVSFANDSIFYYQEPFEVIDPIEIGRYITPYGIGFDLGPNGFTYVYDVTDYQDYLQGDVDFQAHNTQELIDIKFKFIVGTPPRDLVKVEKIWGNHGSHSYNNLDNDVSLPAVDIDLDPNASTYKIRTRITGHGHNGSNNCCEWGQGRNHEILVDGTPRFTWEIFRETACGDNPNTGQGGTWPYAREGWCPGDIVPEFEFELTPYVTAGSTVSLDYDITDVPVGDPAQGNGNYNMAMHLVSYGAPNFANDAAIVDVLNPNSWEYYSKWNPTCSNPRVILKNTGSNTLTSCTIFIWVGGFDNVISYDWTGNLEFLEQEVVEIPITDDWWYDFQGKMTFTAKVELPNNVPDEYPPNSEYTVPFEATPVYNEPFYIWFKTNNKAFENKLYLKDEDGNVIFSRTSLTNNTEYKDTMYLPQGCYTLEVTDSDNDGLSFWYSSQVEGETAGFLRLRQINPTQILWIADNDFGNYVSHSFTVGFALDNEEQVLNYGLDIYPNPSTGIFNLTLDNFKGDFVQLTIYSETGSIVHSEKISDNNVEGFYQHELNLSNLPKGIYMVQVVSDQQVATKRIVIQ
ncbi:MAG: T9SS type A sorting domain-containing protein [Crocinitomicaceae bacterium]|nr:T9SS type A sorting domain-containing protein [Crocinitomicaceae bacterium]